MIRISTNTIFLLLAGLLISCLQEVNFNASEDTEQLVVEACISNKPESYRVKLTTLGELNSNATNTLGPNAVVTISEIDGSTVQLKETNIAGEYQTQPGEIVGEVGRSYQLRVQLNNGDVYQSSVEVLPEPIQIANSEVEFVEEFIEQSSGINRRSIHHDIDIEIENTDSQQFFKVENSGWAMVEIGYGTCEPSPPWPVFCWQYRDPAIGNSIEIGTNLGLQNNNYKQRVLSVPVDFKHEYVAIIELKAMSLSSYNFWAQLKDQLARPGGLFDRPFAPIAGNIANVDGGPLALGYFHAYAVTEEIVCFSRADAQVSVSIPGIGCFDQCIEIWGPIATYADIAQIHCQ